MTSPTFPAEVELTEREFERVSKLIFEQSRIVIRTGKEGLVRSRLGKHLRRTGTRTYTEYLDLVAKDSTHREMSLLVDSLTTNKTSFYREGEHFDFLGEHVVPELFATREPVRIWSAGCSSGEEPYTIGMVLHERVPDLARRDVRILATDLSSKVLAAARAAEYPASAVAEMRWAPAAKYFVPATRGDTKVVRVRDDVRELVQFARLNLMGDWPMRNQFQVIFCRNVMIYFDRDVQQQLVQRYYEMLVPGGYLFVGHSESLTQLAHQFRYVVPAGYIK